MLPSAETGDLRGSRDREWLANKAFHRFAIVQNGISDSQRRRHSRHKSTELMLRHSPHFHLDARSAESILPHQARLGWHGSVQGIEPVSGRRAAGLQQARAALGELPI